MSYHKNFSIINAKTREVYEEFHELDSAEKFLIMLKSKGEDAILNTKDEEITEDITGYNIEGKELEEPTNDFGSDLDVFNEEPHRADNDLPDVDQEDL